MHFVRSFLLAVVTAPLLALAQASNSNPFTMTNAFSATAGQTAHLTWTPTTGGTVTLTLRYGSSNDLTTISTIASNIPNDGSYQWMVPASALRGSAYTIEIASDQNPDETNFSGRFILNSDNVGALTGSSTSGSVASTTDPFGTGPSPSHFPDNTRITIVTTPPSASTMSTAMSSQSSSMMITTTVTTAPTPSSSSDSSTSTDSSASSSSDQAGLVATGSSSTGAAPRATAMVGMLGAVALGALAL